MILQVFLFASLLDYTKRNIDKQIFLLLLPLSIIMEQDRNNAIKMISDVLLEIVDESYCKLFSNSIVYGLMEESSEPEAESKKV